MIVVGIGNANHDCNISAYADGSFRYCKYEREIGVKHARAPKEWFVSKLKEWGIQNPDLIVEVSGGHLPDYERRILNNSNFVQVSDRRILIDHHYAHAWSNSKMSSKNKFVVIDGGGSIHGTEKSRSLIYDGDNYFRTYEYTPGKLLYAISKAMKLASGEHGHLDGPGKIMGLSAYGEVDGSIAETLKTHNIQELVEKIKRVNVDSKNMNQQWFNFIASVDEYAYSLLKEYFSTLPKKEPIVYSGGCALNVSWNRRLIDEGYDLQLEPAVYDGGLSLGCVRFGIDFLGLDQPILSPYIQDDTKPTSIPSKKSIQDAAEMLAKGKILAWYQGKGEIGPRALGNRSMLMSPLIENGKETINNKVKKREWWRPFGASVKSDKSLSYFDVENSPYMLVKAKVKADGLFPITHVDNSCRHQTVSERQNSIFYELLDAFEKITGSPVLLNTSLNISGKPIAGDPSEVISVLNTTELDGAFIGNEIYCK